MPELPEVETICRGLAKRVIGKKISRVDILEKKMVSPKNLTEKLKGLKITGLERRAKLLIFKLSSGDFLAIHLKLTGQLIYRAKEGTVEKYTRLIFTFSDNSRLFFNDLRKFGYLKIVNREELERIKNEYGVEPLTKEFNLAKFKELLVRRPRMKIKQLLMDQRLIAGLGNIYADEACFYAGVRPHRLAGGLSEVEAKKLWQAIPRILKKAIIKGGASTDTYVDASGRQGEYESSLMVYGRGGEPCKKCGNKIVRIILAGRGAHYCPKCQK